MIADRGVGGVGSSAGGALILCKVSVSQFTIQSHCVEGTNKSNKSNNISSSKGTNG